MKLNLSSVTAEAKHFSEKLQAEISKEIAQKGKITFARYMQLALYAPGLGYYSGGAQKFGETGDFVTAPEISPLFSQCVARQCQQILTRLKNADILELGAGSGVMAVDILKTLEKQNCLPQHYFILELSAELQQRQRTLIESTIPHLLNKVSWLSELPTAFEGVILANEVMDAMPVNKFKIQNGLKEFYVNDKKDELVWELDAPTSELTKGFQSLSLTLAEDYESEINLFLSSWISSLSSSLKRGLILLIDYGFSREEYYHPERSMGTLMCHFQHQAHENPLILPGIQDITAHVDFTAVAEAADAANLNVTGYTTQANFLLNTGIADSLPLSDPWEQYQLAQAIKRLTLPSEMGELFKVIALTRQYDEPLLGFLNHNQVERLACRV